MADTILWRPPEKRAKASNLAAFMKLAADRAGRPFDGYAALHEWSVTDTAGFWQAAWDFLDIRCSTAPQRVIDDPRRMPGARWFEGARLNFAENLLRRRDEHPAILYRNETMRQSRTLTFRQLHEDVARIASGLRAEGVRAGDRVAAFMPNMPETVVAMLAATSLGAVWSSCSPDFGVQGVLDRFARLEPKVLFTADGAWYNGRAFDSLEKVAGILARLGSGGSGSLPRVVVVPHVQERPDLGRLPGAVPWADFGRRAGPSPRLDFAQLPFEHPVYVMYSSGTTGLPKCIVQPAGGVLVNQLKEHVLHVDLKRGDVIFYFTTCGWMMWNWLVAALGVGATIALFDGSPFHGGPEALWRYAEEEGFTVFGTSASYLAALEKSGLKPREHFSLTRLRTVLSTGSPLGEESFEYVYRDVKRDLCLSSISGGTDLNGCFVAGCPILPVYRGEIQCRCLGMDVRAWDESGHDLVGAMGELVCAKAFPSMPVGFFGDHDGSAYRAAYFERFPGVWTHGDFISINERGGVRITGRSDATLNPGGVRIGTAEIYRQVEPFPEVADSLVIAQEWGNDVRVVLFVKMAAGHVLTADLEQRLRQAIRTNCSPRHVPARIVPVADVPYTLSGKKVELAVRDLVHGRPVKNRDALRNPQALDGFVGLAALKT